MDSYPSGSFAPAQPPRWHWWAIQAPADVSPISGRRAYAEVLAVFAAFFAAGIIAGGETLAGRYPAPAGSWAIFVPAAVSQLGMAGVAALVVISLSGRRGIGLRALGLGLPMTASGKPAVARAFRIGVWAVVALLAGGIITGVLATGKLGQPLRPDDAYLVYAAAASLAAGVVEEMVVLAFVITTLRQANRPLPEIVVVAVLLRCGSVIPLIVVHFLWDLTIFFEQKWHAFATLRLDAFLLLPLAAGITWFVGVMNSRGVSPAPTGRDQAPGRP